MKKNEDGAPSASPSAPASGAKCQQERGKARFCVLLLLHALCHSERLGHLEHDAARVAPEAVVHAQVDAVLELEA